MNRGLAMTCALTIGGALLPGCGGPDGAGSTDGAERDMPEAISPYPQEPYGNRVGEVLEDFRRPGYRLSRSERDRHRLPWDEGISLADFHFDPACRCLLITVGTTTCGACAQEQPHLSVERDNDPGFCVLGVLQEGSVENSGRVTRQDVDDWTDRYRQNFPVIQGNVVTSLLWSGYGPAIGLPFNVVVEPRSMTVAAEPVQGFRADIHDYARAACAR